jgi:integrase/recombinase XerD
VLSVYTRHYPPCPKTDIHYRRCRCPKWIRGLLENSGEVRVSARTRSWQQAEGKARVMEQAAAGRITVERAVDAYMDDEGRNLSRATVKQRQAFLERRFLPWCRERHIFRLDQLRLQPLREFRQSWDTTSITAARWHERLRSFFVFCVANSWLPANPMNALKKPLVLHRPPTDYFKRQELQQIVDAAEEYEYGGGRDCWFRAQRMQTLVLLMRWGGLAIKDAVGLKRNRLDERGVLFLRRAKTGVPVFVPLPPAVASLLWSLPSLSAEYFFWSGNGDLESAVKGYQRSFRKLFHSADLRNRDGSQKRCHSHMFRDTFAVELLLAGVPIDQVSILLGHRSVKMTEKHYLPWVKARQKQLTASVRRAWFDEVKRPPLQLAPQSNGGNISLKVTIVACHSLKMHHWAPTRITHPLLYV